ncbi:hypothetical protein [Mycobacterium sp.]|uniref:hypothetical protein n=1 Tax=Mycobacterium sp. TaxID=1785 RepID=UPI002DB40839|nr:hypothetical protein [Mycobacterium sp.]
MSTTHTRMITAAALAAGVFAATGTSAIAVSSSAQEPKSVQHVAAVPALAAFVTPSA